MVQWDKAALDRYRWGAENSYDLEVIGEQFSVNQVSEDARCLCVSAGC
jgi:hypothetical protein